MNLETTIDNQAATREQLEAADRELTERLERFESRRLQAEGRKISIAKGATPEKDAASLVAELQAIDLLVSGAQQLQADVRRRIAALKAAADRLAIEARWAQVRELLDHRNALIDEAEAAITLAAKHFEAALEFTRQALLVAPEKLTIAEASSIREGALLIPAATQRLWWSLNYRHPQDIPLDNLYAHQVGNLSRVFGFECQQILGHAPTSIAAPIGSDE